mmetsp:Transcript_61260/g.70204  ORF Transcript_61260/g.70204 Transcript_61260/m.70204 type:complete len:594 (+) Transcript_61260:52-1833(+)
MKQNLIILIAALVLLASSTAQNPDEVGWVPQEYTALFHHKDYEDWGGHYEINGNPREGFVGDFCEDEPVFGANAAGGGVYDITATYELERPIYAYMLQISVWLLDSWDNETVTGEINNNEIFSLTKNHTSNTHEHCGRGVYKEHSEDYFIKKNLSAETLNFRMHSNADQDPFDESMGISNVKMWVAYCDYGCRTCDGQGVDSCIECMEGFDFNNGACIPNDMALTSSTNTEGEFHGNWKIGDDVYEPGDDFPGETCDGDLTFGVIHAGRDKAITGTFNVPERATACAVQFDLWMVDSWDTEVLTVNFEGEDVADYTYWQRAEDEHFVSACGKTEKDDKNLTVLTPAMLNNGTGIMTLTLSATLNQNPLDESFGIANVKFFCELCHPTCQTCSHPSDPNGCTSCYGDDLLHVPRDSSVGSCRQPTTECLDRYVAVGNECREGCEPHSDEGREGIQWLYHQEPQASVSQENDHLVVRFTTEIPEVCYHEIVDIQAYWVLNKEPVGTYLHIANSSSTDVWEYKVYILESELNDHDVCHELTSHDAPVLKYSCSIYFDGSYGGDATTFWVATVLVEQEDGVFTDTSVSILTHPRAEA